MARRKAEKIDIGGVSTKSPTGDFEKPARKKREGKGIMIYRVVSSGGIELEVTLQPVATNARDLKSATKQILEMEPGQYAIGRLTFLEVKELPSVRKVVVRS